MSVGKTLKYKRKAHGISQLELANQLHVSRQSVSSWENDRSVPSFDNLILLADLYKVTIDDLLKDNKDYQEKIKKNQEKIKQYEEELKKIDSKMAQYSTDNFEYSKEDEFLFQITLIFIGLLLLPLGPLLPISYYIIKKNEKRKVIKKMKRLKTLKLNSGLTYTIIALNIIIFYLLFTFTENTIFLILFLVESIAFTLYGFYLILSELFKSIKK